MPDLPSRTQPIDEERTQWLSDPLHPVVRLRCRRLSAGGSTAVEMGMGFLVGDVPGVVVTGAHLFTGPLHGRVLEVQIQAWAAKGGGRRTAWGLAVAYPDEEMGRAIAVIRTGGVAAGELPWRCAGTVGAAGSVVPATLHHVTAKGGVRHTEVSAEVQDGRLLLPPIGRNGSTGGAPVVAGGEVIGVYAGIKRVDGARRAIAYPLSASSIRALAGAAAAAGPASAPAVPFDPAAETALA